MQASETIRYSARIVFGVMPNTGMRKKKSAAKRESEREREREREREKERERAKARKLYSDKR